MVFLRSFWVFLRYSSNIPQVFLAIPRVFLGYSSGIHGDACRPLGMGGGGLWVGGGSWVFQGQGDACDFELHLAEAFTRTQWHVEGF